MSFKIKKADTTEFERYNYHNVIANMSGNILVNVLDEYAKKESLEYMIAVYCWALGIMKAQKYRIYEYEDLDKAIEKFKSMSYEKQLANTASTMRDANLVPSTYRRDEYQKSLKYDSE